MNNIKQFMELFEAKRAAESWQELIDILKDCHQYFKNVPKSERNAILSLLLHERRGLIAFLKEAIERLYINNYLHMCIALTAGLLTLIIETFFEDYKPYIKPTVDLLTVVLTMDIHVTTKMALAKTFETLVRTFQSCDIDFNPTIEHWMKRLHRCKIQERRIVLHALSVLERYFPQADAFNRFSKVILRHLMTDWKEMYETGKRKNTTSRTYVEALNYILCNFPPSEPDGSWASLPSVYEMLKSICSSPENFHNKGLMTEVVDLLAQHLHLFSDYVYKDYKFWHQSIYLFVNNRLYETLAIKALKKYYETIGHALGNKDSPETEQIFLNLHDCFMKKLANDKIDSIELQLSVYGLSQILEPGKNFLQNDRVNEIFSLIAHRTIPLYSRENNEAIHFEEIADYQEALSKIIRHSERVSTDQMRTLTTLCTIVIKHFPELLSDDQKYAISALNKTMINVRYTKEIFYQDFITKIIYEGISWSCSHMLLIDAELIREAVGEDLQQRITYKDYLPLWQGLLNPENYSNIGENSEIRGAALRMVVDEVLKTCISLINTLNLRVLTKNVESDDAQTIQTSENRADFRIFLNVVDLYVEILPTIEHFLWSNLLHKFLYELVRNSYKNPLISGFYKLVNASLSSCGAFRRDTYQDTASNGTFDLILHYLWNVMDSLPSYSQELQISCLQLVLNVPEIFVPRIVDRAAPTFRISLNLGLTNFEIAFATMAALERWRPYLDADCSKNFIPQIIPCLELYLQSEHFNPSVHDVEESERTKASAKKVTLADDDKTMEGFQRRILLFLGSLESNVMLEHIHKRSLKTGATWSKKDLLKYTMPFADMNLEVNLDELLPRIIELALNAGDRQTRVVASDALHTLVSFVLGRTMQFLGSDNDHFASIYKTLCPALLRLGCDSDDVIRQIYGPLVFQLTHWLSSRAMNDSLATTYLIDSLFEGLYDETSSSLRDACGLYLAEFVRWSIKQLSNRSLVSGSNNIDLIVRRIVNCALDPSGKKRIAAAIAFNSLYKIIRENEDTVSIFWFTLLCAFVKSLEGFSDSRINDSLSHIERVLIEKSRIFNRTNVHRVQPPGFIGTKMIDAVMWIFQQCGSTDRECRRKCMDMFAKLSPLVDGTNSPRAMLSEYMRTQNISSLNGILLQDLDSIYSWSKQEFCLFQRSLDLYTWIIRDNLVDCEILFTDRNPLKSLIFETINNFVIYSISKKDSMELEGNTPNNPRESVSSRNLSCELIINLLDFILVTLDVKEKHPDYIPDELYNFNFFSLVSMALMRPEVLGFDSSNLQLTEQLPTKLDAYLIKSTRILSAELVEIATQIFATDVDQLSEQLFQIEEILDSKVVINENAIIGLIHLQKYKILKIIDGKDAASAGLKKIFDALKRQELDQFVCCYPRLEVKTCLSRLMELLMTDNNVDTIKIVMDLVTNTDELRKADMTTVTHGEYFLSLFRDEIARVLFSNVEATLDHLKNSLKENPESTLRILEIIVQYLHQNRNRYDEAEKIADAIIEKHETFEKSINNLEHRKNIFSNTFAMVVRLRKDLVKRDCNLYRWIYREFDLSSDFKYRIRLLRDFLVCLTDENSEDSPELEARLAILRNDRKIITPDLNNEKKKASTETIDCFHQLLKLLSITRSRIVLDGIMNFSSGAGDVLCEENLSEYLKLYFSGLEADNALKSLEITYKRFRMSSSADERLDILRYYLLPAFNYCTPEIIEKFFQGNIREIYETVMEKETSNIHDRKQLFVSKIGCYNLIEILFARIRKDKIDSKENPNSLSSRLNENKLLSRAICQSTLSVRQLISMEGDDKEILRILHCSAYKSCIAIVCTEPDDKLYIALFGENHNNNQYIWKNIIDVNRKYDLRQTSKDYPKYREKLINIRKVATADERDNQLSYIKSYDLATSTLNENLYAYDLNAVNLLPQKITETKNESITLRLEIDDLNEHECMGLICGFLKIVREKKNLQGDQNTLPNWLEQFRVSMKSEYENVRLFLLKIILNSVETFRPYAKFFLEPLMSVTYRLLRDNESLNYVITDAITTLIGWSEICVPTTEEEQMQARRLFPLLVKKSLTAPSKFIVRYNFTIIEMLVDAWHDCLLVPDKLEDLIPKEDRSTLKLILIFLTKKMHEKVVDRNDIWEYILESLVNWKIEEESILRTFEAAGLMIEFSSGNREERKIRMTETVTICFSQMQVSNPARLVKCLHALTKNCNELAIDLFHFVSSTQLRVSPACIVKCLEIFLLVLPRMKNEQLLAELTYMRFEHLLTNRVLACEKACLRVVSQLVDHLEAAQILGFVKIVASYSNHEVPEYRQLCYETFAKLYKKYSKVEKSEDNSEEAENPEGNSSKIQELVELSKKVLLSGLLDSSELVEKLSLDFWSEVTETRDTLSQRFLEILNIYTSGVETNFLQIATLVVLELTRKSVNIDTKLFEPLFKCAYREHEISTSWKSRNYESRIPLYAPSIASQHNQILTQRSYMSFGGTLENYIRSNESLEFEPTYVSPAIPEEDDITEGGIFAVPKIPELPKKMSRRFLEDWSKIEKDVKKRRESKQRQEEENEKQYFARRRGQVKIHRRYRIGDFPDIEISHMTLLSPMRELIKRDTQVCKNLMKILATSLIERESNSNADYRKEVSARFARILEDERENEALVATIFEIFFNIRELRYSGSTVTEIAKKNGLCAEGAILVEQELMEDDLEPPTKRPRNGVDMKKERWVRLAALYESMDELDPVLGIFRGKNFSEELHSASLFRAANDWTNAEEHYRKAFETETDQETKIHCLRGTYECLARLGDWETLVNDIAKNTSGVFDLLPSGLDDQQWMRAWTFRAHTQRILENSGDNKFLSALESYLNDDTYYERIKANYGEKTAIIMLRLGKPEIARDFLNSTWEKTRQRWLRLSPLAVSLRSRAVVKLRGIYDMDRYLRTLRNSDIPEASRELMTSWSNSVPTVRDDLLDWIIHISYRCFYSENLMNTIGVSDSQEGQNVVMKIRSQKISQELKLIDCAVKQKNVQLAKKYILEVHSELTTCQQKMIDEFELSSLRWKFLRAETSKITTKRLKDYSSVWIKLHELLDKELLSEELQIGVRQVISELSESLAKISNEDSEFFEKLNQRTKLVENIFADRMDDNVADSLNNYSFSNLLSCCSLVPRMAECHLRLSRYCYERISRGNCESQMSKEFVRSTLRAMSCGSEEATYYFPCLLRESILSNDEIRKIFNDESDNVETWRFLIWQPQLLSHLATSLANCVAPIIRRIIDNYPNAVLYPIRLALDTNTKIFDGIWGQELRDFLNKNRDFDQFYQALEYVVSPKLHLSFNLREFSKNVLKNRNSAVEKLKGKLYPEDLDEDNSIQGNYYRELLAHLKPEIEKLIENSNYRDEISQHMHYVFKKLSEFTKKGESNELKFYSPWLNKYVGREIEVPGQYKINCRPNPRYHAKIVKLESMVEVMHSLRKPVKMNLIASDGKNYSFLVKYGEDLRVDQRVEQIFEVMNEKLKSEAACSQRRLSIETYQVFPLTGSLGLIQWIEGTKTLGGYINFSADKEERKKYKHIEREYDEWIRQAARGKSTTAMDHREALLKYKAEDVRAKMQGFINKIHSDTLRRSFVRLSTCMKGFMSLRQNFTSSYATMCVGQWILGIGDRHPGNTLINVESGRCVGIDFGSAFGGGVDQSVPELMPFRLTSQMKGLVEPFNEYDSMGVTMVHVLRALKNSKGSLLACFDVVAHEQLNWLEHVKNFEEEQTENSGAEWIPENKVKIVCEKLDGGNPSKITLKQLADRHSLEPYFSRYVAIVNGTDTDVHSQRSSFAESNLSPEEQVQCLVEQATDLNVLGRVNVGWAPWL